jgi:hypothetical protein
MALVAYTDENEETTSQPNAEQSPSQEVQTQTTSFSIVAYSIDEEEIRDQNVFLFFIITFLPQNQFTKSSSFVLFRARLPLNNSHVRQKTSL